MRSTAWTLPAAALLAAGLLACGRTPAPAASDVAANPAAATDTSAARGAQLALLGGCDDCHTPRLANGDPDMSRRFSGMPAGSSLPPVIPGVVTWQNLAWRGPWGLSQASNITPDVQNGIGAWSEAEFLQALKTGKDPSGRVLQAPMPIPNFAQLPDNDLIAIYNFIKTVKPSSNKVTGP